MWFVKYVSRQTIDILVTVPRPSPRDEVLFTSTLGKPAEQAIYFADCSETDWKIAILISEE